MHSPAIIFGNSHWRHQWRHALDLDGRFEGSSHIFSGVLGPIQSVPRAEYRV